MSKWSTSEKLIRGEALKAVLELEKRKNKVLQQLEQEVIVTKGLKVRFDYLKKITGVDYKLFYEKDSYAAMYIDEGLEKSGLMEKLEEVKRQIETSKTELDGCDDYTYAVNIVDAFRTKMQSILEE